METTIRNAQFFARRVPLIMAMMTAGLLGLFLAGCGGSTADGTGTSTEAADETTVDETDPTAVPEPTAEPAAEPTETPVEVPTEPPADVVPNVDPAAGDINPREIFAANCARCHGEEGEGTARGKPLLGIAEIQPDESIHIDIVTNGKDRMPAWGEKLTPEEIVAVVGFVRSTF